MKPNNSSIENSKSSVINSESSYSGLNGDNRDYTIFNEDNLPPHHFDTVKEWLEKLNAETLIFAEALVKKLNKTKQDKLFTSETFNLDDINHVLCQLNRTLDNSVNGLIDFRSSINDYISTWKVALKDGIDESSDSSVEVVASIEPTTIKGKDILNDENSNDRASKDSKDETKTDDKTFRLRIRKPSELNRLAEEEMSNDSNSQLSNHKVKDENINHVSSSDECVICSNDEDTIKSEQASKKGKSPRKLSLSVSKEQKKQNEINKSNEKSKENAANSSSDDCMICSDGESNNTMPMKEEKKNEDEQKKLKINWDTSTESEMSEEDWIMSNKKSMVNEKSQEKKKKKLLSKKERAKTKKGGALSSSDDDLAKLCNLKSLKKRKRISSSGSCESDDDTKEKKKPEKKSSNNKKSKKDEVSLMDCLNESGSDESVSSTEMTFELDFVNHLKSVKNEEGPKLEEFGTVVSESDDGIPVLTDSSLDSIFDALVKKKEKVSRGSKKNKYEGEKKTKLRKRRRDKLLDEKLTDTDTNEGEERYIKRKMKTRINSSDSEEEITPKKPTGPQPRTTKNSLKSRKSFFSDSDASLSESESQNDKDKSEEEEEKKKESEGEEEAKAENKKKRKRIQRHSDSSEDEDGEPSPSKADGKGRRNIRKVLKEESLQKTTKEALKEEEERKKRIAEKQKLYNDLLKKASEEVAVLEELVLDFDIETKKPLVSVDKDLVKKLKPHQAQGIKFMWDSCFESVKDAKEGKGSGCILAHCMGLGKTLQVVTLVHTLLTSEEVDVNRVLVVCPFSTVQNWVNEFRKWLKDIGSGEDIEIYNMIKTAVNHRSYQLRDWERTGGVLVLGYNLFRTLVAPRSRMKASIKKAIEETLLDPGPDVVVCDEGHILKNEKTAIAKAMSKLKTRRRIVLTGTPLQNNLVEYHCMVQFVKPNLLGTRKEFQNRFVHPIQNGQFEDSTAHDVKIMKRRAHVLHKMLDGIVQRKDYSVLTPYLPPKYEYVIHVKLTEVQCKLYRYYLDNLARKSKNEGGGLFQDFQHLMRICTHPRSLLIHSDKELLKKEFEDEDSEGSLKDFIDDGSDSDEKTSSPSSSSSGSESERSRSKTPPKRKNTRSTRASGNVSEEEEEVPVKRSEWWSDIVSDEELQDIRSSSKLFLFFTILKHCEEIGDKLLVFSQSLYTLDLIEHFLDLVDENAHKKEEERNPLLSEFNSNWDKGLDYFRLDGSTSSDCRNNWCKVFNQASNTRGRLFLISTRAGGLGINLTGANRVIIFDASWNPSFDVQSIFRVYRFGQEKPCYIYRFLSKGTMEEKIYERQVAKLSTSLRVIDEQQIDRHFTQTSLAELYAFLPESPDTRETPILPKDRLMAELIQSYSDIILKHHQHDSLLENQEDEELNEEERKAAWQEFENEKNNVPPPNQFNQGFGLPGFMNPNQFAVQANIILNNLVAKVRAGNPLLNEDLVKKRAMEVLQSMPFWQNQQQNFMNSYVQQQQQQYYQQQLLQQQQQILFAQQQQQLKLGQTPKIYANSKVQRPTGPVNGTQSTSVGNKNNVGGSSQPIEIQDDE